MCLYPNSLDCALSPLYFLVRQNTYCILCGEFLVQTQVPATDGIITTDQTKQSTVHQHAFCVTCIDFQSSSLWFFLLLLLTTCCTSKQHEELTLNAAKTGVTHLSLRLCPSPPLFASAPPSYTLHPLLQNHSFIHYLSSNFLTPSLTHIFRVFVQTWSQTDVH